MKVCFIGDIHAAFRNLEYIVNNVDADIFIQCGDYGLWTDCEIGKEVPSDYQMNFQKPVIFVEGNHDNHSWLEWAKNNLPFDKTYGGIDIAYNLIWMPRGYSTMIGNKKFLFCGGADSIDKDYRLTYYPGTWWPGEIINESILNFVKDDEHFDFVVTHDRPKFVSDRARQSSYAFISDSSVVLEKLFNKISVDYWINGHWHLFWSSKLLETNFVTLDMIPMKTLVNEEYIELEPFDIGSINKYGSLLVMEI